MITDLTVVDLCDTPLIDTSLSNIPASSADSLVLVASLSADIKRVLVVEDIGEYMGIFKGPINAAILLGELPLGGGYLDVKALAGDQISIRSIKNSAITTGFLAINFLG